MSKYLLSYDEEDVKAGRLDVDSEGVLKSAGAKLPEPFVVTVTVDYSNNTVTADQTVADMVNAYKANKNIEIYMYSSIDNRAIPTGLHLVVNPDIAATEPQFSFTRLLSDQNGEVGLTALTFKHDKTSGNDYIFYTEEIITSEIEFDIQSHFTAPTPA